MGLFLDRTQKRLDKYQLDFTTKNKTDTEIALNRRELEQYRNKPEITGSEGEEIK